MRGPYKRKKAVKAPKEIYKLSDEEEPPKDFPSGAFHFLTKIGRRYKLQRTLKLKKRGIYEDL